MRYDFAIIGAGPGGYTFAIRAAQFKKKCIVFDENNIGGTCLNVGCIPSKVWINVANLYKSIKNDGGKLGIIAKDVKIDWQKVQEHKNTVVAKLQNGIKSLFKAYNIDYKNVTVNKIDNNEVFYLSNESTKSIETEKIILATGGIPIELKEFDYKNPSILTYKNCFNLDNLPESVIVVGGGIIGIELGQVFSNFGVKVYIVELLDSILTGIDKEAVDRILRNLRINKVSIFTGSKVDEVKYTDGKIEAKVTTLKTKQTIAITADKLIVAVGIKPKSIKEFINCSLTDKGWVKIDENFKTSLNNVYAIGDITGPPYLAHRASFQARFLAENLSKNVPLYNTSIMPFVIFSEPEVSFAGLQEHELQSKKIDYTVSKFYYSSLGRAVSDNKIDGFVKVFTTVDKKEILGVVITGKNASDLIGEYTLAMEAKLSPLDLALTIHPHPTYSELIPESAENAIGFAIHSLPH